MYCDSYLNSIRIVNLFSYIDPWIFEICPKGPPARPLLVPESRKHYVDVIFLMIVLYIKVYIAIDINVYAHFMNKKQRLVAIFTNND